MNKEADNTPATHEDLDIWGGRLQFEIQESERRLEEKLEKKLGGMIRNAVKEITDHIDAAVEIKSENILGGTRDKINLIDEQVEDHEKRILSLEQS